MNKLRNTFNNILLTTKLNYLRSLNLNSYMILKDMVLKKNGKFSNFFLKGLTQLGLCCILLAYGMKSYDCENTFTKFAQCAANAATNQRIQEKTIELNNLEKRASILAFNANEPIEDRHSAYELKNFPGYFLAVLDGHGGAEVADYANERLYRYFDEIYKETKEKNKKLSEDEVVVNSILKAFERIEKEYYQIALEKFKGGNFRAGRVGSCVLMALVTKNKIYTAQLGDSKAKLFRKNSKDPNVLDWVKLSITYNAEKKKEQEYLTSKFSGEKDIVICKRADNTVCYVKGRLQPTRSLGDFHLKFKEFNDPNISKNPIKNFTGPYIQAVPDIKILNIDKNDQYIVMASDGMWDFLESKDVSEYLKQNDKTTLNPEEITRSLFDMVMSKAAEESNLTLKQIMNLPSGKKRSYYDDTTIIVFDLKH